MQHGLYTLNGFFLYKAEVLETDERVGRRYLHQIEELRDQLEREKETACNRERDLAQTR